MNEQLKRCSICGSPAEKMWDLQEKLVRCTNRTCHNSLYSVYLNEWQERPIEDELQARIAALSTRIAEFEAENKWLKAKYERLKAERRWIPVEERLPKDNEYVLVYCSANGFYNIDCLYDGSWLEAADYYEEDVIVTHWMPLPEPPEVKDE